MDRGQRGYVAFLIRGKGEDQALSIDWYEGEQAITSLLMLQTLSIRDTHAFWVLMSAKPARSIVLKSHDRGAAVTAGHHRLVKSPLPHPTPRCCQSSLFTSKAPVTTVFQISSPPTHDISSDMRSLHNAIDARCLHPFGRVATERLKRFGCGRT